MFFGLGIGTKNRRNEWLDVYFPLIELNPEILPCSKLKEFVSEETGFLELDENNFDRAEEFFTLGSFDSLHQVRNLLKRFRTSKRPYLLYYREEDKPLVSVADAYFKLHCLSKRLFLPNQLNLEGIFACLPNVAWTNQGAVDLKDLHDMITQRRLEGNCLSVNSIDKFPKMTDYVVPLGVRIADTSRIRLGAYLGEGTTVMHEGFINFNAGTEGKSMIEGRISAKVFVGEGSDLGGGCSTMGTMSGGGKDIISIGKSCLIGANAGVGIALGDRCTLEAGLYLTAGSKVRVFDKAGKDAGICKARNLSGRSDMLFRRNSINGVVECLTNRSVIELNDQLHLYN